MRQSNIGLIAKTKPSIQQSTTPTYTMDDYNGEAKEKAEGILSLKQIENYSGIGK